MLRRTQAFLFRRTPARLSGGELYHPPKLEDIPPSSATKGFFGAYNGGLTVLRFVDIKWMMNRAVELGREYYISAPTLYLFLWMFCWKGFVIMRYGDGKPPRRVDWNTEEAGYLPKGFEQTKVTKAI
ncbi:hypothetical protein LPMP_261080 [Leishmania panamensis]|uniref:Uncharacterized protein n=7 Tax=Viannia TaxID=37616 RepID=A4HEW6_LEIBR|nr:conserved hypothetical protein [Leishmania braziliensis MHOM/BR/75/M2904]XP_010699928.1 hypothetical protein LPMP_261080 [Leishmania panamensis]CAJ2474674.1 unnamed protein product [Leishmania braziliensis]CCM16395.1 hypothetical protein, conserved [Leishmania guyanensis]AIN99221.1 hypothetical protein LPMP_261080 [Leishmania panamensis]CAJ2475177.1 unnamed protein product [Leishmania braziliensis]CAM39374.1 conserved hypothetical protein [Leishmania braziliensis MHOM/BR/75/M2904]